MPSTPIYALPYPAAADPADVPTDMQELAERLEVVLGTMGLRKIAEQNPAAAATVDFSGIPQTYAHLRLVAALVCSNVVGLRMRFNNDATAKYHWQELRASGAAPTAIEGVGDTSGRIGWVALSGRGGSMEIVVPNYTDAALPQSAHAAWGEEHATPANQIIVGTNEVSWDTGAAINRITLLGEGAVTLTGRVTLYGMV